MSTETQIWGPGYRVFLSHDSKVKTKAARLKCDLESYGISAFLAHTDIHPTEEWQEVIKEALRTMDAFVALLTEEFHNSNWTDQEVGYALCREVPIIPVRLGIDPYGFIGKFQGLSSGWEKAPQEIIKLLMDKHPKMVDAYIETVKQCGSFDDGNHLANMLDALPIFPDKQVRKLVDAFNGNSQVKGSYGFNGTYQSRHGEGLSAHLRRLGKDYDHEIVDDKIIFWNTLHMDLVREILLTIENFDPETSEINLNDYLRKKLMPNWCSKTIYIHIRLVEQNGFLNNKIIIGEDYLISDDTQILTRKGHDFLDSIRAPKTWDKAKKKSLEKFGMLTLESIKETVTEITQKSLTN